MPISGKEVNEMMGIVKTNSVCFGMSGIKTGQAIFHTFSLLSHCCSANCRYSLHFDPETGRVEVMVRAKKPVKAGEELSITYVNDLMGNYCRSLKSNWKFVCQCRRCEDPTENQSFLSGVKCWRCQKTGFLLPKSTNPDSKWFCSQCEIIFDYQEVKLIITGVEENMKKLSLLQSVDDWEELLNFAQKSLHPSHFLVMEIKRIIIQILGNSPHHPFDELTIQQLNRKLSLCANYLDVYSKVDATLYGKWRGSVLEEMIPAIIKLTKESNCEPREFKAVLSSVSKMLKHSMKCKQYELNINSQNIAQTIYLFNTAMQ